MQNGLKESAEVLICRELRQRLAFGYWRVGDLLPNEHELADELSVSRATMNKALRQLDKCGFFESKRGRGRIVSIPKQLKKATGVINIVLSDAHYYRKPSGFQLINTIQDSLITAGYNVRITTLTPKNGLFHHTVRGQALEMIRADECDGLIVVTQAVELETALELSTYSPVLWFHHPSMKPSLSGLRYDWINGSIQAVRHLIAKGHRSLALVNISENFISGREQLDGIRVGIKQASVAKPVDFVYLPVDSFDKNAAYRAVSEFLSSGKKMPSAFISGSDDFTSGICKALSERKLKIPKDVSLISWNDTLKPEDVPFPVDALKIDFARAGRLAAENMLSMIKCPEKAIETIYICAELIVRGSVRKI